MHVVSNQRLRSLLVIVALALSSLFPLYVASRHTLFLNDDSYITLTYAKNPAVSQMLATTEHCVMVLACGEHWRTSSEDGELRFAIEGALSAGAIPAHLPYAKSPEARFCEGVFTSAQSDLAAIVRECGSGRDLCERGFGADVEHAARLNAYDAVPVMRGECFTRWSG